APVTIATRPSKRSSFATYGSPSKFVFSFFGARSHPTPRNLFFPINFSPMPHCHNFYLALVIINNVDNSVFANAQSILFRSPKLFGSSWPGGSFQTQDSRTNSFMDAGRQLF